MKITTRQLVSHLAGIRHYEKPLNSSSSKNKEAASKELNDNKSVSLLLVFVGVFCFLLLCLHVGNVYLISTFTVTYGFPGVWYEQFKVS